MGLGVKPLRSDRFNPCGMGPLINRARVVINPFLSFHGFYPIKESYYELTHFARFMAMPMASMGPVQGQTGPWRPERRIHRCLTKLVR